MTNYKQIEVVWHVENLKVSYVERFEITNFAGYLSRVYGVLKVCMVKVYDYFGMDLNYSKKGQ